MQRHEIEERVLDVLYAALKCAVPHDARRSQVAAWDSLKHIELVFALEDELELRFEEDELATLDSVQAIVAAIEAKTSGVTCSTAT